MPLTRPFAALRRAASALALLAPTALLLSPSALGAPPEHARFARDRVLARFAGGEAGAAGRAIAAAHGAAVLDAIPQIGLHVLSVPPGLDAEAFVAELADDEAVEFAELDVLHEPTGTPNDTYYSSQWHLPKIAAPTAWDTTTGNGSVTIAILDSGVDAAHPDLANRVV